VWRVLKMAARGKLLTAKSAKNIREEREEEPGRQVMTFADAWCLETATLREARA